ncbi:MAG: amidohydrolase [Betaproteobacteria bacterium]|nr:amidohydrolase [Betaproteobacteria bacterium]
MTPLPATVRVDTHFHVFEAGVAVEGARYVPAYAARLDDWWRCARSVGMTHGVLVQPSFLGTDNRVMLASLRAHSQRLRGVAVVKPDISAAELVDMHAAGVRGIRLNLVGGPHDIGEWVRAKALWDQLLSMNWHVELHTDRGRLPAVLPQLPAGLPIVVDHMGKPLRACADDLTIAMLRTRAQGRLSVKLSGAYRLGGLDPRELAQVLLGELGPSALLWGSDWPCTNHERCADYPSLFASLGQWVDQPVLDAVLHANPLRLLWGREPQVAARSSPDTDRD